MAKRFRVAKRPPKSNVRMKQIRQDVNSSVQPVLDKHLQTRRQIVSTWNKRAPNFEKKVYPTRKNNTKFVVFYKVEGDAKAPSATLSVYRLLNDGTRVRYAKLSSDWVSKTAVKQLSSSFGSGRVEIIGNGYKAKGIKARGWEKPLDGQGEGLINPLLEPNMTKAILRGYRNGFKSVQGQS